MCSTLSMTLIVPFFFLSFFDKNTLRSFELAAIKSRKKESSKLQKSTKIELLFSNAITSFLAAEQNFRYNIDEL